jgi:protein-disulfide isomerase
MIRFSRRASALLALAALALAACQQKAAAPVVTADEMSMGDPKAKITVVEYASAGCPFCARFNNEVFPGFKTKWVDTGKARYVYREMLVGGGVELSLGAAGFLLARCAGQDHYFGVLDAIYHQQETIFRSGDARAALLPIAKSVGLSDKQFDDCVSDTNSLNALNTRSEKAGQDGIGVTPTIFINGKKAFESVPTPQQLDAALQAAG